MEPLNGRKSFAANMTLAEVTTHIRVRYRPSQPLTDRKAHKGQQHDITAIIDSHSSGRELVLMCKANHS